MTRRDKLNGLFIGMILFVFWMFPGGSALASPASPAFPDDSPLVESGISRIEILVDPLTAILEDGRIIHLAALDIPDYYGGQDAQESAHAPAHATAALTKLKEDFEGEEVRVYAFSGGRQARLNRMGHLPAHIVRVRDRLWAQGLLLSEGLARVRTLPDTAFLAPQMYQLERGARESGKGLWADPAYQVLAAPFPQETRAYRFVIAEGTVRNTASVRNRVYLNFGEDWRTDFTVSIPPAALRRFEEARLDPLSLAGRKLRVHGWLESYNGPYIEIDHPARLEIPSPSGDQVTVYTTDDPAGAGAGYIAVTPGE